MAMEDLQHLHLPSSVAPCSIINQHSYPYEPDKIFLLERNNCSLVVGGDFNPEAVANLSSNLLKTSGILILSTSGVYRMPSVEITPSALVDIKHSPGLYYIFVNPALISGNTSISTLPILLSDHSVFCSIDLPNTKPRAPRWRLNTSLRNNSGFLASLQAHIT